MKRLLTLMILVLFALAVGAYPASAAPRRLTVAYPSISGEGGLVPWIAQDKGLFDKNGLDVKLVYIPGGTLSFQALLGGSVDLMIAEPIATYNAFLQGADIVSLGCLQNYLSYFYATVPSIKRLEELKGKVVGVNRFGSGSDLITRTVLRKAGLVPEQDVRILQVGGSTARIAALSQAHVQGALMSASEAVNARRRGLNILDIPRFPFARNGLITHRAFVKEHEEVVRSLWKAYLEGVAFLKGKKEESLRVVGKYMKTDDRETLEYLYQVYAPDTEKKPYCVPEGIQNLIEFMAVNTPRIKTIDPMAIWDFRILKEIDQSGFIDRLY